MRQYAQIIGLAAGCFNDVSCVIYIMLIYKWICYNEIIYIDLYVFKIDIFILLKVYYLFIILLMYMKII